MKITARITEEGKEYVRKQVFILCARVFDTYNVTYASLEREAVDAVTKLHASGFAAAGGVLIDIPGDHTVSGKPARLYCNLHMFDYEFDGVPEPQRAFWPERKLFDLSCWENFIEFWADDGFFYQAIHCGMGAWWIQRSGLGQMQDGIRPGMHFTLVGRCQLGTKDTVTPERIHEWVVSQDQSVINSRKIVRREPDEARKQS